MSTVTLSSFDTLACVKRLKAADVPEKQAEAQAEALRAALETHDVATRGNIALLEAKIASARRDTIIWLGGISIAGFSLVISVMSRLLG